MKKHSCLALVLLSLLICPAAVWSHDDAVPGGRLGKVSFANSCSEKVKPQFEIGVAMLHSFWFSAAEKTFDDVLAKDPQCAIAAWGLASILMNNPLAGTGASPAGAKKAFAALENARQVRAGTQRERDYIDAVSVYYEDWANRGERARQVARADAFEKLAARYPQDDEAQIFYALYRAGTQSQADQTYSAYLKAAAILEVQFKKYPGHPGVAHYLKDDIPSWTGPRYMPLIASAFGNDPSKVPFDFHELIGSLAPRPFFASAATRDDDFDVSGVRDVMQIGRAHV